jgi:hypothetical protein
MGIGDEELPVDEGVHAPHAGGPDDAMHSTVLLLHFR